METTAAPRIELQQLDTKSRRIVDAARDCFAADGFEETTMVRIADVAGVGVATVYRRFGTKSAIVRYALMAESQRVAAIIADTMNRSSGPVGALADMFAAFVAEATAPRLLTRSLRTSSAADQLTEFLTGDDFIEQGRALVSVSCASGRTAANSAVSTPTWSPNSSSG